MDLFIVVVFQYLRSTLAKACNATPNLMSAGSSCSFEQHFSGRPQLVIMDSNIQHIENLPPVRDPSILSEEYNFHKWYIDFLKANNYGESELNCGYEKDLRGFVHVQKNQHAHCPKDKLTRQEFCHILAYLVSKMPFENVSPKFMRGLLKRLPTKDNPNSELWVPGIAFIHKEAGVQPGTEAAVVDGGEQGEQEREATGESSGAGGAGATTLHSILSKTYLI